MIGLGQPAPWFYTPSPANPNFAFSSLGGRYVLLAFLPEDQAVASAMTARLVASRGLFDGVRKIAFRVTRNAATFSAARDEIGLQWFFDPNGQVSRGYGALEAAGQPQPRFVLTDPSLRVLAIADTPEEADRLFALLAGLPEPDDHAGTPLNAPVLIVPRVLEPDLCRALIALYDRQGGQVSGTMVERERRTVPHVSDFKSRRDANIEDLGLQVELRTRLERRLIPEMRKAFQFNPTRLERYIVACYDGAEGGYFKPHRDNTTKGTAHRKFACSINLNAEDYQGGDLRFPEYGSRTYRPPTGGAVVFSCSLLHEATPVRQGRRYAFLPFFYDEAGHQIREANLRHLDLSPPGPSGSSEGGRATAPSSPEPA